MTLPNSFKWVEFLTTWWLYTSTHSDSITSTTVKKSQKSELLA